MKTGPQKSVLSIFIVLALVVSCFVAIPKISAVDSKTSYLKGADSPFDMTRWQNIFGAGNAEKLNTGQLIYAVKNIDKVTEIQVISARDEVIIRTSDKGQLVNGSGSNQDEVIIVPYNWMIAYVNKDKRNQSEISLGTTVIDDPFDVSAQNAGIFAIWVEIDELSEHAPEFMVRVNSDPEDRHNRLVFTVIAILDGETAPSIRNRVYTGGKAGDFSSDRFTVFGYDYIVTFTVGQDNCVSGYVVMRV